MRVLLSERFTIEGRNLRLFLSDVLSSNLPLGAVSFDNMLILRATRET